MYKMFMATPDQYPGITQQYEQLLEDPESVVLDALSSHFVADIAWLMYDAEDALLPEQQCGETPLKTELGFTFSCSGFIALKALLYDVTSEQSETIKTALQKHYGAFDALQGCPDIVRLTVQSCMYNAQKQLTHTQPLTAALSSYFISRYNVPEAAIYAQLGFGYGAWAVLDVLNMQQQQAEDEVFKQITDGF